MSTIEHTATSTLGKIPIGRRISELLQERGDAFSIRAFAPRVGMNRETFRLTLIGERPISLATLENVAEQLNITEDRLRQMDTFRKEQELVSLLNSNNRTKLMLVRAQSIAQELVDVAQGATERGFAYNNLGRVQFLMDKYDEAHQSWKQSLAFARVIHSTFEDTRLLKIVSANLMMACARLKDYGGAEEMLQMVEELSADDHDALGMVAYSRMVMYIDRGRFEMGRKYAYQSLDHFQKTNDIKQIGHGHINVARVEFLLGNYHVSTSLLASALEVIQDFDYILVKVVKDYIRSLIKQSDYHTASEMVAKYDSVLKQFPDYWYKVQIMNTVLEDDPAYAEGVVKDLQVRSDIRSLACRCLFEYYAKRGDAVSALRYYELERSYSRDHSEFLDKEGF